MIKTLIFDIGNVLVFFDPSKMVHQIASCLKASFESIHSLLFQEPLIHGYEKGVISTSDLFAFLRLKCNSECPFDVLLEAGSNIFQPNTPLISSLIAFKNQGLRLVILSNTVDMHIDYVRKKYAFLDLFDALILSYKVGMRKPEEGIYLEALKAAHCSKEETLFIDDMEENIQAAQKLGIPSYHFRETHLFLDYLKTHHITSHVTTTL